jgi:hypothetical protein
MMIVIIIIVIQFTYVCAGFWWESPKEKDPLKDQGVDGRMGPNGP